ncbi:MAG: SDR family NAD(P)-dependent oxidoreductase [Actinomycetota bacterium]
MAKTVLVTGGAGFIGSHVVDGLIQKGYHVRVLDSLEAQVHPERGRPLYLTADCELIVGDIRDHDVTAKALQGADIVVHLAAIVGVGQSMYEIARYVSTNVQGTAVLLQEMLDLRDSIERVTVASSMSLYGEGSYFCPACGVSRVAGARSLDRLRQKRWEPTCSVCDGPLEARPTPEEKRPQPTSIYAVTKRDQEEMLTTFGRAYGVPTGALRFFNVYGARQALGNPYTGAIAIFAARLLNDRSPILFEDGNQLRDFVHVSDLVRAHILALETATLGNEVFNIGTGRATSILEVAQRLADVLGSSIEPDITYQYREGDIRNCYSDIERARQKLGYEPRVDLDEGLTALLDWLEGQRPSDLLADANRALRRFGLLLDSTETADQPVRGGR